MCERIKVATVRITSTYQIKPFLLVYGAVRTTINGQGVMWVYGKRQRGVRVFEWVDVC